ncbi:MAG: hypothetical protein ABI284_08585 [Nitrosospira sp.]
MKSIWLIRREVSLLSLVKRRLPLIILVIFIATSIVALNGLARNIAQKRDFFSDPLCTEALWKKTYHAGHSLPQASTLPGKIKTAKSRKSV